MHVVFQPRQAPGRSPSASERNTHMLRESRILPTCGRSHLLSLVPPHIPAPAPSQRFDPGSGYSPLLRESLLILTVRLDLLTHARQGPFDSRHRRQNTASR